MSDEQPPTMAVCPTCEGSETVPQRMVPLTIYEEVVAERDMLRQSEASLRRHIKRLPWFWLLRVLKAILVCGILGAAAWLITDVAVQVAVQAADYWQAQKAQAEVESPKFPMETAQSRQGQALLAREEHEEAVTRIFGCLEYWDERRCLCLEEALTPSSPRNYVRFNIIPNCYRDVFLYRLGQMGNPHPTDTPSPPSLFE